MGKRHLQIKRLPHKWIAGLQYWLRHGLQYGAIALLTSVSVIVTDSSAARANPFFNLFRQSRIADHVDSDAEEILQIEGELKVGGSVVFQDGSLYEEHPFEGQAGQHITITLESKEFNPYLILIDPRGDILDQNDDISATNHNSAITVTLPVDGTYSIIANSSNSRGRGRYILTVYALP